MLPHLLHEALSGRRLTKLEVEHELPKLRDRLLDAQFELRKSRPRAVAMIVSGIPGAGRSEVVNELLGWLDPKFVTVYGFREPNDVERQRPLMWRYWRVMPPKGRMVILHGGWYDDFLADSVRASGDAAAVLRREVGRIRRLERMLVADGVAVVKVHLHVGPELQRRRIRRHFKDKTTRLRVTAEDHWFMRHYARVERALEHFLEVTDQPCAPWHVIDGTDRQHRALEVGKVLLAGIEVRIGRGTGKPSLPPASRLRRRAARVRLPTTHRGPAVAEEDYDSRLEELQGRLALLSRRRRFARHSVVVAFEGMDASGKGGSIRRITAALSTRGSTAWCRSRHPRPRNSRARTSGDSGSSCRRAASTRSSIDWRLDAQAAVALPNFGSRIGPTELEVGTALFALEPKLRAIGHETAAGENRGGAHLIVRTKSGWTGAADPRREGTVRGD